MQILFIFICSASLSLTFISALISLFDLASSGWQPARAFVVSHAMDYQKVGLLNKVIPAHLTGFSSVRHLNFAVCRLSKRDCKSHAAWELVKLSDIAQDIVSEVSHALLTACKQVDALLGHDHEPAHGVNRYVAHFTCSQAMFACRITSLSLFGCSDVIEPRLVCWERLMS